VRRTQGMPKAIACQSTPQSPPEFAMAHPTAT
jgi:hypothetical protein